MGSLLLPEGSEFHESIKLSLLGAVNVFGVFPVRWDAPRFRWIAASGLWPLPRNDKGLGYGEAGGDLHGGGPKEGASGAELTVTV